MTDHVSILRDGRRRAGLTQEQLGRRLGVSQAAIARLESRDSNPTVRTLVRVLGACGHRLTVEAHPASQGVDESLIRRHLELTPVERLRSLDEMQATARKLAEAGKRSRGTRA